MKGPRGPNIRTKAKQGAIERHRELTLDAWAEQAARGLFFDARRLFDEHGNARPFHSLSEKEAACIAGFEVVRRNVASGDGQTDQVLKYRLVDRTKFLELVGRYLSLFKDKLDVKHRMTLEELVSSASRNKPPLTDDKQSD